MPEIINPSDASGEPARAGARSEGHAPQPSKPAKPATPAPLPGVRGASRGQTLFEYALIILFVVLAVVLSLALIAPALNHIFNQVPNAF